MREFPIRFSCRLMADDAIAARAEALAAALDGKARRAIRAEDCGKVMDAFEAIAAAILAGEAAATAPLFPPSATPATDSAGRPRRRGCSILPPASETK